MDVEIRRGDILTFNGDAIVNPWNRNIVPWWLLFPRGVSGAIKKKGGKSIFKELSRHGSIPLGGAVYTSSGKLPYKAIIHVASIDLFWRTNKDSIRNSVNNAVKLAEKLDVSSLAFPIIGAGSGGYNQEEALKLMLSEFDKISSKVKVTVFKFREE